MKFEEVPLYNDRDIGDNNKQGTVAFSFSGSEPMIFTCGFMLNDLVYSSNPCTEDDT